MAKSADARDLKSLGVTSVPVQVRLPALSQNAELFFWVRRYVFEEEFFVKTVARGYVPEDEKFFSESSIKILKQAARDIKYLINHGYNIKNASVFVGNHYTLSERQRLALVRSVSADTQINIRKKKETAELPENYVL